MKSRPASPTRIPRPNIKLQLATTCASQAAAKAAADQLAALCAQGTTGDISQVEQAAASANEKATSDQAALANATASLIDRSTIRFAVAVLKGLSPEQLAWGTMQATGQVDVQTAAAAPEAKKQSDAIAGLDEAQRLVAERLCARKVSR